ncbi:MULTISPECIES: S8 family serine peptidase [unclassified Massilia]|uniref:S8 family serine peptidase n=1 Tax=unclassified Massilia TaxID=2609279 RepID=UPI001E287889|nr:MULTISPECIES: S8 family serine peptidase [unclassified Massilia]
MAPRQPAVLGAFGLSGAGLPPLPLAAVERALRATPEIEVVDTIGTRGSVATAGLDGGSEGILVARMTDRQAGELHQRGGGRLLVERDQHLHLLDPMLRRPDLVSSLTPYTGAATEVAITVLGRDGAPLADAEVSLFGGMLPAAAVTDASGTAHIRMYGDDPRAISGLYVKPRADYWSFFQRDPELDPNQANIVALHPLSESPALQNFPRQQALGWGARAMRLDAVPPQLRGQGVKIAVIDSGAATSHANLARIRNGFDIINKRTDPGTWTEDTLGHGSHCAGVIGAADIAWGIRGFAPDAEIHVCKLFPGGQVSQLIEALEYCIEQGIDVVNMSLGGGAPSEALERQIARAKAAGVACIAAAGNSGGPVQYPAASPNVLAVAAIGKLGEFPPDSYHTETLSSDVDGLGYFTAKFSCFGPQVDVCAPGVAIVSSVPPNNFAAWDGTSMAAPHITGLAALILAHRPEFQGLGGMRSPERVERLFQFIRLSARRVTLADPTHIGSGMPDALAALGLSSAPSPQLGAWQPMFGELVGVGNGNGGRAPLYAGTNPYLLGTALATQGLQLGLPPGGMGLSGW